MRLTATGGSIVLMFLLATTSSAQTEPGAGQAVQPEVQAPADRGPSVHFRGFADINFAATSNHKSDDGKSADGFSLGNLVGHVNARLGGKFSFFGEVNVTSQTNIDLTNQTGSTEFVVDVARAFIRYDYNDRFKVSAGRYHAPIGYWNVAFHRGLWLQTTIFRPDIIREEWFQPDHFTGVMAEGTLVSRAGLHYIAGYGNGRDGDLQQKGLSIGNIDGPAAAEVGHHRAGVVRVFSRPPQFSHVEFGGAVYRDTLAVSYTDGVPEWITSAYFALTAESPEILAEFSNLRHKTFGNYRDSQAFYVQLGYRLPQQPKWKPYGRFEKSLTPFDEPIIGNLENSKLTVGLRYELTDFATLKMEYGQRRKPGSENINGFFAQSAFTF